MGARASVSNLKTKRAVTPIDPMVGAAVEKNATLLPYALYPYQLNAGAVEELRRVFPDVAFVEYYHEKASFEKKQGNVTGREVLKLTFYEHPDISMDAPKNLKVELLKNLSSGDPESIALTLDKGITPNESIGKKGYGETVLHHLAKLNNFKALKVVLDWIKTNKPVDLSTYLNIPDVEGNTPVMTAAICDAVECVYAFFHTKGRIDVDIKNKAGLTLVEICKYFSTRSRPIVNRFTEGKGASFTEVDETQKKEGTGKTQENTRGSALGLQEVTKQVEKVVHKHKEKKPREPPSRGEVSMTVEDLKLTYQQIRENLSTQGSEFRDSEFEETGVCEHTRSIVWKRDYEILEKEKGAVKLLGNVSPYDILESTLQTKLCGIFQALACAPSVIRSTFNTKESNPQGVYSLTLYVNGIPKEVVIDNIFPVDSETKKPAYFRTVGKKLWTNALGKALAKLHGGYHDVDNELVSSLIKNIIPIPTWQIRVEHVTDALDESTMIGNLKRMISPHTTTYLYTRNTCRQVLHRVKASTFYEILKIVQVANHYVVVGKNLFGHDDGIFKSLEEYTRIGVNVKQSDGFDEKAIINGVFPLQFSEFRKHVDSIFITPKMMDGKYTYIPIQIEKNHAEYFEIEISKEVTGWFTFSDGKPEEAILLQDYYTKPKIVSCKYKSLIYFLINYLLNLLGSKPDKYEMDFANFDEITPGVYPPGKYVLRAKNIKKESLATTLGFYGTDYVKIKRGDRTKYKNFITEFLKASFATKADNDEEKVVSKFKSYERYSAVIFWNFTKVAKVIDVEVEKRDSSFTLPKIFAEKGNSVQLIARPGEMAVLYAKDWTLGWTHKVSDYSGPELESRQEESPKEEAKQEEIQQAEPQQENTSQTNQQGENVQQTTSTQEWAQKAHSRRGSTHGVVEKKEEVEEGDAKTEESRKEELHVEHY